MTDYLRAIRLCKGKGDGKTSACLATATAMIAGELEPGDEPECLCPAIRAFVIQTNDAMPDDVRSELYGDLPWVLIGTRTDDKDVMQKRAYLAADYAVRKFAPIALRADGLDQYAAKIESLPEIVDKDSASQAAASARAAGASGAARAAYAAGVAADAAAAWWAATDAAWAVADAASARARAADAAAEMVERAVASKDIWPLCRELIIGMAAIGSKTPIEPCMDREQLAAVLGT